MITSKTFFFLLKRFFNYYRVPLSVINKEGETLFCFPQVPSQYVLPPKFMKDTLNNYFESNIDSYTPFFMNAPYDSFIAIVPLPSDDFVFIGPAFSRPLAHLKIHNFSNKIMTRQEIATLQEITKKLPLVDEAYLTDAISLLVLLIHYKEVLPKDILSANYKTYSKKTSRRTSHVMKSEYDDLLLFETKVQYLVQQGKLSELTQLWKNFSASVKEGFDEYMFTEHHLMIPLLSSARQAAISGGAPKEEVISIFHNSISQISTRGSLSINLKNVERATYDLCSLVKKNKSVPFRTELCMKCEQYIDSHMGEKITAADIADYCSVDRSIIFDIFRKNYGMSLTEYIQGEKMRRAKILLLHSTASISEIASILGFCSSSYFSKVFMDNFNCTPSDFRSEKMENL